MTVLKLMKRWSFQGDSNVRFLLWLCTVTAFHWPQSCHSLIWGQVVEATGRVRHPRCPSTPRCPRLDEIFPGCPGPDQVPEPPQLPPFYVQVQQKQLYSEFPQKLRTPHRISKLSPVTLPRELISAACISDLILSVTAQSSWPELMVGTQMDW